MSSTHCASLFHKVVQKQHLSMSKYLFLFLIFWYQVRQQTLSQNVTGVSYPAGSDKRNYSTVSEKVNEKPLVYMNEENNYILEQQTFYLNDTNPPQNKTVPKYGDEYLVSPGIGVHKFHSSQLTWSAARRVCVQEGGHMAILNSFAEETLFLQLMYEANVTEIWLGLHDLYEEGDWVSVLDQTIEATGFTKWTNKFPDVPDNWNNNQHCASLVKEGGMDDIHCGVFKSFFCEFPLV